MNVQPVTLEGAHVRLEPLSMDHLAALTAVGLDPELWRWTPFRVTSREEMAGYIEDALKARRAGSALTFATIDRASARPVGSTRYMNIDAPNRRVEIGSTWIARDFQRSHVNTEAKFLMLRHAFETLGCMRVELKTDALNRRSRNAIQRIGARQEGVFRNHVVTWTGRVRHSVYFSITDAEWPEVKSRLESQMARVETGHLRRVYTLSDSQIEDLHRLYQKEWWTAHRSLEKTRKALEGASIIVAFADAETNRLIAFARVLTDGAFKALVFDVIVDPAHRKSGLGKLLMDTIVSHPDLAQVEHIELYCKPELTAFYERWGFKETPADLRFMRRQAP